MPIVMCCEPGGRPAAMSITVADAVIKLRADMGTTAAQLGSINGLLGTIGITAAAVAGAAFVKMGMDAQTQLSIVAGLTGSSAAQMQYYTTSLETMGTKFGS